MRLTIAKKIALAYFITLSLFAQGQLTDKKIHLTGKYSFGSIDSAVYQNFSAGFEWHLHKYVGINYSFELMLRNDDYRHIHTPMGLIGGPIIILASAVNSFGFYANGNGSGIWIGLLILALPDGISGHIPVGYKWDLSPYANVLGIDFVKNRNNNDSWIKYACSFGTRVNYSHSDNLTFSTFLETRKTAGYPWGVGGGIGIGYAFGER